MPSCHLMSLSVLWVGKTCIVMSYSFLYFYRFVLIVHSTIPYMHAMFSDHIYPCMYSCQKCLTWAPLWWNIQKNPECQIFYKKAGLNLLKYKWKNGCRINQTDISKKGSLGLWMALKRLQKIYWNNWWNLVLWLCRGCASS